MNGILLIDKPSGITSHDVVKIIRKKFKIKKVGHAGTLDPLASGLLIIMIGKYTKKSNILSNQSKKYLVEMKMFLETDSGDITGKIVKKTTKKIFLKEEIKEIMNNFNDYEYWQIPPIYSAIKIKGKKLYEYARKKIEIKIPPRLVKIKKILFINYCRKEDKIVFEVECSKGTYIRSLVKDLAFKLENIATVIKLRRISSGNFNVNESFDLKEINENLIFRFFS